MSSRLIETYPVRELTRQDGKEGIEPGCAVSWRIKYSIDIEGDDVVYDGGYGLVVAVYPDEYVPNQEAPGLVATVVWSRPPTLNDRDFVTVPYVPMQTTRFTLLGRAINWIKGAK